MTNSFLSENRFRPQAQPVNTYVSPSTVAPATGFDQLVNALQTVNPSLNKYFDYRIKEEIADEKADITMQVAQQGFKGVIKKHRAKYGDDAANQLIGGSIFTQNQFEKLQAQDLGQSLTSALANLYQNKTFEFTLADGTVTQKPIHHFSGNSPQYQEYLQDAAALTAEKTEGISNKYLAQYFFPYQQKAIQDITASHIKQHNEYKVERHKNKLSGRLLSGWTEYEAGNEDLALAGVQEYIEETVNLGLPDAVSAKNIINVAKNQASRIYEINQQNGGNGYNAAMKYLEMVGKLKHGPKEKQKDGTYKQRVVADSFGLDILNFKTDLANTADKLEDREIARIKKEDEDEIIKTITENPNSFSVAAEVLKRFPTRREFVLDQIEIYADSRDELFNSFNYKVGIGYYGNDVVRMLSELDSYKGMIGPTWTDEDEKRYKESAAIARSYSPKNVGNFNNRIKDMHREVRSLLGAKGDFNNTWDENKRDKLQQYLDLKTYINNRIMDEIDLAPGTPREKEERFRAIKAEYYQDVEAIMADKYKPKGSLLTEEQRGREDGIQALVDDYGLGIEDATKIYDEEFVETVIGEEESEETEEDKEKSWIQLLLDGLKGKDNDELVSQLNDAKQNLGESETGVIDSVLNALMGSVTAGDLEDNLNIYTVKEGDNLSTIADQFSIDLDDLVEANDIKNPSLIQPKDKLIIPPPRRDVLSEYKGKAIPDFGGLAKLVRSGESRGHGSYNAFNKGTTDTAGTMDITSKTIAEMEQLQADGKVSAVGAYQFTPGVLTEVREYAGIEADAIMTPAVQDKLFSALLLSGKKKTILTDYLLGYSDDLRAAHEALALEFAALQGPDGVGMYDKDKAGNIATIEADKVKQALIKARKELSNK